MRLGAHAGLAICGLGSILKQEELAMRLLTFAILVSAVLAQKRNQPQTR